LVVFEADPNTDPSVIQRKKAEIEDLKTNPIDILQAPEDLSVMKAHLVKHGFEVIESLDKDKIELELAKRYIQD
jgi:hypothetical protein